MTSGFAADAMDDIPPSRLTRLTALLVAVTGALSVGALAFIAWHTVQEGAQLRARAEQQVGGLSHIVAEQTSRTLQAVDSTLIGVMDVLKFGQLDLDRDGEAIHAFLERKQEPSPYIMGIFLVDPAGRIVQSSLQNSLKSPTGQFNVAQQPYFMLHQDSAYVGLYVSSPRFSKARDAWMISVSRRINRPDGSFGGVVVAAVDPMYLSESLDRATLKDNGEIAILSRKGALLWRSPFRPDMLEKDFESDEFAALATAGKATLTRVGPFDDVRRIYALEPVPDLPIYVLTGIGEEDALAGWLYKVRLFSMLAVLIVGVVGGLFFIVLRDWKRRNDLLKRLHVGEQRFRDFAEAASDRFWQTDAQHRMVWHSALAGPVPDYIGKTRWENLGIDPNDDPVWFKLKDDMDNHRPFRDFHYIRNKPNGVTLHRIVSGKAVFDDEGVFIGYRGTYCDVTAQVIVQERAQRNRDRFLRSIENLSEGFALYDSEDRLVVCNTRYQEIYGHAVHGLTRGASFEALLRECVKHSIISEAKGNEEEWISRRMAQHRNLPNVQEVKRKGRWLQVRERADKEGGTMILVLDIHEQKVAELQRQSLAARLQRMFDDMPAGCILLDPDRQILDWNPMAERIFGFSKAEALGRSPFDLIVPPELRTEVEVNISRLCDGESVTTTSHSNLTKDGRTVTCEWINTRLSDGDGRCAGIISMVRDISEKRIAEEKLRQTTRMEAIGQLTGGIAHDFNNLLQVVIGNSEILIDALADTPQLQRWASMTKEAADRGAELTLRLLAYSRRQTLEPVQLDLNGVVDDLMPLLERSLGASVAVTTSLAADPWSARLDRAQIDQALLNLILNARDAMPNGGTLRIETANVQLDAAETASDAKPGDFILVSVTDSGTGMAPEIVKRAFEPFFTTKDVGKGSGLGLSMVHGFVNQSGGLVRLDSEVGKGTTVRIYFPRAEANNACAQQNATAIGEARKTVLVVEDNDMVRTYVIAQLESLGYDVIEAENGPAALIELESAGHIDLLFTDVIMPGGMNGRELAERALKQRPELRVLFTSGYDESAITTDGHLATGTFLLRKPYQRKEMASKILEVLNAPNPLAA
ncbi:MAG TPA: PAS domain S-box protein [Alphaproteobacteria bacterium]|jgi:PAS domain S-box-containing protein